MNVAHENTRKTAEKRSAHAIMQPERLGASRITSLSFCRSMLRKVMKEKWKIERTRFDLDQNGYGEACYTITTPNQTFSFIVFSQHLDDQERSDRVISEKWDITFALCEGPITPDKRECLHRELPRQEAGRGDSLDLVWSRANRSTRLFDYIIEQLTNGNQPDSKILAKTGYMIRTTAVYGNGKFGIAPYERMHQEHSFYGAFRAQMFAVFMIRQFSFELVDHIAQAKNPRAAKLHPEIKRYLGVGNATGLGMVPYLISHPQLIHTWIYMKEEALAKAKHAQVTHSIIERLLQLLDRSIAYFQDYPLAHVQAFAQPSELVNELQLVRAIVAEYANHGTMQQKVPDNPWVTLCEIASTSTGMETQELVNTLLIELYPEIADEFGENTSIVETYDLKPQMQLGALKERIHSHYSWALRFDFTDPDERKYFWYRSAEKEEPRMGIRGEEPGEEHEMPVNIAERVQALQRTIAAESDEQTVAEFVLRYPEHKWIIRRIQALQGFEYGEIHGNLLASGLLPVHLLRCKLAFFGAERFDPQSNRWVRVTLMQGAPLVEEIGQDFKDDWIFPVIPRWEDN
ncbi:hypothetical protein [Brevibacillus centrosporus]|uniref:hypothetical protein n=1 Tax=Brevibacillus centrosporus TaxID=54910 RepID=UPI002E23BBE6|nr:hypothetical protein [Brevibacillus centrosporus]